MPRKAPFIYALAALAISGAALSFSTGPPVRKSGAPGDDTCVDCHNSFALNSGPGIFDITAPTEYFAGDTIDIQIDLAQAGQERWGFEATILDADDEPVGTIYRIDSSRTRTETDIPSGRVYITHTSIGTDNGTPDVAPGWTFKWIAPASSGAGTVTVYAAGNAANGANGNQGDYIYTRIAPVDEGSLLCCEGRTGDVDQAGTFPAEIDSSDLGTLVNFLFSPPGTVILPCVGEADVDGSGGPFPGRIDSTDLGTLVNFLFSPPGTVTLPTCLD